MVETCVGPSELHLKKELTAIKKSRLLRDPETCSSWRSPLSSRSVTSAVILKRRDDGLRKVSPESTSIDPAKADFSSNAPLQNENRRRKVYLYNWGNHSRKSSDSGIKFDLDSKDDFSPAAAAAYAPTIPKQVTSKEDLKGEDPIPFKTGRGTRRESLDAPARRTKKVRRKTVSKANTHQKSTVSELLDLQSNALAFLNSKEPLDGTEYSNSEDLERSVKLTNKNGCFSQTASPLFSVSGHGHWSDSSKMKKNSRKEESSYSHTPVSTSSYNRFGDQNPSTAGSWDGTLGFDEDDTEQMGFPARQGCGIPCYSSKRRKDRGCGGWYSPSLSDTLRRKGSSILCGSQMLNHKRRSSMTHKGKVLSKTSQGLPLLTNTYDQVRSSAETDSDELSTIYGELDLEALSRLDGSRWSNCKSQDMMDIALTSTNNDAITDNRSLSQKYRPIFFDEIVGQNIVVQSLSNAILRGRIAPAYLFQGSRGTGKTSVARIFAAALNCLATEHNKPCGLCQECTDFASEKGSNVREVDAANTKGPDLVKYLMKNVPTDSNFSRYRVFIIDECHLLSSKMWSTFMKLLEDPPSRVVFIFITTDLDNLPHAVVSRCQKYLFPKIKDSDVVDRLGKICSCECLDIELEALNLIASNSNGSLRDAETMLDQLCLLGKTITVSLVNDLVGVVPDDKLLDLLEIAMSADTAETVRKSREILDSGIDPMKLMSQLAGLIMDIIAGTHQLVSLESSDLALRGRPLTEPELDRLQQALKILSDAEKQLRHSCEQSTWFTAALLEICSGQSLESANSSGSGSKHSAKKFRVGPSGVSSIYKDSGSLLKLQHSGQSVVSGMPSQHSSPYAKSFNVPSRENSNSKGNSGSKVARNGGANQSSGYAEKLEDIWKECIAGCHSEKLRNLLYAHGKLISLSEVEGVLVATVTFQDARTKSRGEGFISSITNSFENVLKRNVEVRIGLFSANYVDIEARQGCSQGNYAAEDGSTNVNAARESADASHFITNPQEQTVYLVREDVDVHKTRLEGPTGHDESIRAGRVPVYSNKSHWVNVKTGKRQEIPVQTSAPATTEQRLESAWLQVSDKTTSGSADKQKPERNKIVPQNGLTGHQHNMAAEVTSHWEDELNQEIKALKINDSQANLKMENIEKESHFSIAPSPLHEDMKSIFNEENIGYDSGPGCSGLLCWQPHRTKNGAKVPRLNRVKSKRRSRMSCFGRRSVKSSGSRLVT